MNLRHVGSSSACQLSLKGRVFDQAAKDRFETARRCVENRGSGARQFDQIWSHVGNYRTAAGHSLDREVAVPTDHELIDDDIGVQDGLSDFRVRNTGQQS